VVAEYVPGVTNREDSLRETTGPSGGMSWRSFCRWMDLRPSINSFAEDHNHHLPCYWTYFAFTYASGINAMAQVWHRH